MQRWRMLEFYAVLLLSCDVLLVKFADMENIHVALATENLVLAGGAFTQVKHG